MKMPRSLHSTSALHLWAENRKLRYLAIGVWNTMFAYIAFATLYILFQDRVHYLVISFGAHVLAVINAFLCQRIFVFRSSGRWFPAFVRFNIVQSFALAWGFAGLLLMVELLHFKPLPSQLIITTLALMTNYLLHRNFSFKD